MRDSLSVTSRSHRESPNVQSRLGVLSPCPVCVGSPHPTGQGLPASLGG